MRHAKRDTNVVSCMVLGSSDKVTDRNAAGLYLFTQGEHRSGLDYGNLLFVSQILKHKNGQGRLTLHPAQSALDN